jgi:Fic family protein
VADNLAVVDDALRAARTRAPLRLDDLHRWHRRLMRHADADVATHLIGALRDQQSWIGGRGPQDAAYVPPPPEAVPPLVDDLIGFVNDRDTDPVTQAAVAHAQFETIHPYGDGNGRIGRLLVLWVLARRVGVAVPPPTSVLVARDPGGYLAGLYWFRTGETARWVEWFAHVVVSAADASLVWAAEVDEVLVAWNGRLAGMRADATARRILDILPTHPVLSVDTTAGALTVSSSTAHAALTDLEDRKILTRHQVPSTGPGRPRLWWFAPELADLVGGWAGSPSAAYT